ncbi:MAG: hypothetical protein M3Y55_04110 [Pseudomonadota bacterium]|nr:hypothetical protein [Pseudomonadota bacterium]
MNIRSQESPASQDTAKAPAAPVAKSDPPVSNNNDRWDADEEPWRHPPIAPKDESVAKSLGRSVSDAVVSAADDEADKAKPKP